MFVMLALWAVAAFASASGVVPVDFHQHGSDWLGRCSVQGNTLLSPIDIGMEGPARDGHFHAEYAPIEHMVVSNDGTKLSFEPKNVDSVLYFGSVGSSHQARSYKLIRMDVRGGSDHTFHGKRRPIEIQMVHKGEFIATPLIVSIFYDCAGCNVVAAMDNPEQLEVAASAFLDPRFEDQANAVIDEVKSLADASAINLNIHAGGIRGQNSSRKKAGAFATLLDALKESPEVGVDKKVTFLPPIDLNALIATFDFFQYSGSLTLPPCSPATWLVQNGHITAPLDAIKPVFTAVKNLSNGFGNYRAVQALAQRPVLLLSPLPADRGLLPRDGYWSPTAHVLERESMVVQPAKDAITIGKAAADYAKSLDERLKNSANEHAAAWQEKFPEPLPERPGLTVAERAQRVAEDTQRMARHLLRRMAHASEVGAKGLTFQKVAKHEDAASQQEARKLTSEDMDKLLDSSHKKAVEQAMAKITPAVRDLGKAYIRQNMMNMPLVAG